ncbi:MAG: glycosyltransferase [Ruminococcaceae bacterium]|nr:glycosyltransferase [Oscillospiraceae bacterium]
MVRYSIIMPVYNKAEYVEKTIRSVVGQSSVDWEIIAVDDESKDDGLAILNRLAEEDSRIKVFSIENKGVSNARNFALSKACGEYVMFLDADDTMKEGLFEEFDRIISDADPDIIFTPFDYINDSDKIFKSCESPVESGSCGEDTFYAILAEKQAETGFFGFVTNKLVKRTVIAENSIEFDTNIKLAEDLDFFLRVYDKAEKFYFSDKKSFNYLQYPQSSSNTMTVDYYSQIVIQLRLKKLLQKKDARLSKGDITDRQITKYVCCYIIERLPKTLKEFRERQRVLYKNSDAMAAITLKGLPTFKQLVLVLVKCRMTGVQYFLINTKRKLRGGR